MEARRLLEDYFSDVKLSIFSENKALYNKYSGKIPLNEAAKIAKQDANILRSSLKDSKVLYIVEDCVVRSYKPQQPKYEELALVFGPFPKGLSTQFIKHFALKTGQACPMLVNSFMMNGDFKASFLIFRSPDDRRLFYQYYKTGKGEKDVVDFAYFTTLFTGIDDATKIDNYLYSKLYKAFRKQCVCYVPDTGRILGLKWTEEKRPPPEPRKRVQEIPRGRFQTHGGQKPSFGGQRRASGESRPRFDDRRKSFDKRVERPMKRDGRDKSSK